MSVMTVRGPVESRELGRVLVHEHIRIRYPGAELDRTPGIPDEECYARAVARMERLLAAGVRTFVDPCPIELGRDPRLYRAVADATGMNIVCATGFYCEQDGFGLPYYWRQRWPEEIAELYLQEIGDGIGDSEVQPGLIKLATSNPVGWHETKVITAAALAAKESGVPIVTHTTNSVGGAYQQERLEREGADPSRVLIGHLDESDDYESVRDIAVKGSFVGIDRIGIEALAPDERRVQLVARLVEDGLEDQVCLSQDHLCCDANPRPGYWIPPERAETFMREVKPGVDEQIWARDHTFIFTDFVPRLKRAGVSEATVQKMFVDNPRRLLAGE